MEELSPLCYLQWDNFNFYRRKSLNLVLRRTLILPLSICLYVCVSLCVSLCPCLSVCMSLGFSVCLSLSFTLCAWVSLSLSLSLCGRDLRVPVVAVIFLLVAAPVFKLHRHVQILLHQVQLHQVHRKLQTQPRLHVYCQFLFI